MLQEQDGPLPLSNLFKGARGRSIGHAGGCQLPLEEPLEKEQRLCQSPVEFMLTGKPEKWHVHLP